VGVDRFRMRITGVGGTGIVTVAQILAVAAVIEDRAVRALDQTGLAQKGGAVVSDLTITAAPAELAVKLGEAQCDLYLGCDALVATDPAHLRAADPDRTIAVVSTTQVPTGAMVADTSVAFPPEAPRRRLTMTSSPTWCWSGRRTRAARFRSGRTRSSGRSSSTGSRKRRTCRPSGSAGVRRPGVCHRSTAVSASRFLLLSRRGWSSRRTSRSRAVVTKPRVRSVQRSFLSRTVPWLRVSAKG
jgi:hypothetical protein